MSRPLRDTDPRKVHLITCRTALSELLLVPHPVLNQIVGGVVALYAESCRIELYAICILGNHYHMLCRAPKGMLPVFAENVNREIAVRVNRLLGRRGTFWGRRYDDQVTIELVDQIKGLLYVLTNPVKHGLVSHPRHWPGVNSYGQALGQKEQTYAFLKYTEYNKAKRRAARYGAFVRREDYEIRTVLKFSVLPCLAGLSDAERHAKLDKLLNKRIEALCNERKAQGKGFLGRKKILAQARRGVFPKESSCSKRPRCYTDNPELAREFRIQEREKRGMYFEASRRFRLGEFTVQFPPYCFRPPCHRIPKTLPT